MKLYTALVFVLLVQFSEETTLNFLKDYFSDKKVTITANLCWPKAKVIELIKTLNKQIVVCNYKNNTYKKHLSTDNYFVFDLTNNCKFSQQLLENINEEGLFRYPLKYLLLVNEDSFSNLLENIRNYTVYPTSDVKIAVLTPGEANIYYVYKVGANRELEVNLYAFWSVNGGLQKIDNTTIPLSRKRKNLKQFKMIMSLIVLNNDSWNHLTDFRYPRIDTFTKQDFETVKCLLEYNNVSYSIRKFDSYGYYNETTKDFNGIVGDLKHQRSHISGNAIYFTSKRFEVIEYLTMVNPCENRFIVRKPSTSYTKNIFLIAFRWTVWICAFFVIILFGVGLWVILNWESSTKKSLKQDKFSVSDIALISLEAVCQQGTSTEPKSLSGKIIAFILFTAFMFLYVSYAANIVVLLQSTSKFESLKDLLESRVEVGGQDTNYMKNYFEGEKKGILRELYKRKIYPNNYYPIDVGMKKVQEGNFAYHTQLGTAYDYVLEKFTNYDICGLQELPGYMEYYKAYIAVPKNSPYKEIFKVGLLKIDEHGITRRTNKRIFIKPKCFSNMANFKTASIYDCYEVLLIWMFGVALSILIFITEKIYIKFKH